MKMNIAFSGLNMGSVRSVSSHFITMRKIVGHVPELDPFPDNVHELANSQITWDPANNDIQQNHKGHSNCKLLTTYRYFFLSMVAISLFSAFSTMHGMRSGYF